MNRTATTSQQRGHHHHIHIAIKYSKIDCAILSRVTILFTVTLFQTVYLTNVVYTGGSVKKCSP